MAERWFREAIGDGLQRLLVLRFDNAPALDFLDLTAGVWVDSLAGGDWDAALNIRYWDEALDGPRIAAAFMAMARTRSTWPAPRDLLNALPPRPPRARPAGMSLPKPWGTQRLER